MPHARSGPRTRTGPAIAATPEVSAQESRNLRSRDTSNPHSAGQISRSDCKGGDVR